MSHFKDVQPHEVIFVTSRSLIVDQQTTSSDGQVSKFNPRNRMIVKNWNGETDISEILSEDGIQTMTYDKLIYMLIHCNTPNKETLSEIKIIVLDECHTLFSDGFIDDIETLKLWIRERLYRGDKIIIGLTATPGIIYHNKREWGVHINQLNSEIITNYKAQNLYCSAYRSIPTLLNSNKFKGKSIVMCYSVADCKKLSAKIKNSAILISTGNNHYNEDEMNPIRDYIIQHNSPPDMVTVGGRTFPLDVLITTSTLREGINLNECCGVKNVICCIPDELHVSQFVGRCRFNIENLIIANEYMRKSQKTNRYLQKCRDDFLNYVQDENDLTWFNSVKHLLEDPSKKPIRLMLDKKSFDDYIKNNWIGKKITSAEQRNEILSLAVGCKIIEGQQSCVTFNKVITYIENELGYTVKSGRCTIKYIKYTYKVIQIKKKEEC